MSDGLEGIVAAETVLSHADGERGLVSPSTLHMLALEAGARVVIRALATFPPAAR